MTSTNDEPPTPDRRARVERHLALLFACFSGRKSAGEVRRGLEASLRAHGGERLDTVVFQVDDKQKVSSHDPRRVGWGTLTAAVVWGLCGALAGGGWAGVAFWAVFGAVAGVLFIHYGMSRLAKPERAGLGSQLPAESSALVMWVATDDAGRVLEATASHPIATASVAAVDADLKARVLVEPAYPDVEPPPSGSEPNDDAMMSIVMLHYPSPEEAKRLASQPVDTASGAAPFLAGFVMRCDDDGRVHFTDVSFGVRAAAKADLMWWAAFGLVFGAIAGLFGGGGVLGFIEGAVLTAVVWGVLGLGAGVLYGLVTGWTLSARKLRNVGPASVPNTSTLIGWVDGPTAESALEPFTTPGSQVLVLDFVAREGGAVLRRHDPD